MYASEYVRFFSVASSRAFANAASAVASSELCIEFITHSPSSAARVCSSSSAVSLSAASHAACAASALSLIHI